MSRERLLRATVVVAGVGFVAVYPMTKLWPAGFRWQPHQSEYEHMIAAICVVLGLFLLRAARDPYRHLSLIWFTVWSSLAHAAVMAGHVAVDPQEWVHLVGDVAGLLIIGIALAAFTLMARGTGRRSP
ncbi:hypothetical protein H7X46_26660 [Pseudonocardia sp. C8]|uniref:DUF6632 domain-containing protein n=1 Tax=Pseudonocardia sp. C8 TaxID=2762759 RepID=UPI00164288E2|nr:DUF6632 domain-containing protein [Pseudonocardia sp. C8]MBC3194636.1 hypothetical protein [Pseudonocardia sp. C8]